MSTWTQYENKLLKMANKSDPFIVFYRYCGEEYNATFDTIRKAKQFARVTGGTIESRLTSHIWGV